MICLVSEKLREDSCYIFTDKKREWCIKDVDCDEDIYDDQGNGIRYTVISYHNFD